VSNSPNCNNVPCLEKCSNSTIKQNSLRLPISYLIYGTYEAVDTLEEWAISITTDGKYQILKEIDSSNYEITDSGILDIEVRGLSLWLSNGQKSIITGQFLKCEGIFFNKTENIRFNLICK